MIGKMKIPNEVIINGIHYTVVISDKLSLGQEYGGEICYGQQEINIRPFAPECQKVIFLHECVHGMMEALGYTKHDEKLIDGLAHQLYMWINDNPEIFKKG